MLDLVPLARAWREVADVDDNADLVGEPLKLGFPHARAIAVAAAGVGGDEELACIRVTLGTHALPPRFDGGDRKDGGVVIGADTDKRVVGCDIVDAVGNRLAYPLARKA